MILDKLPIIGKRGSERWITPPIKEFMGIEKIKSDAVFLKDGRALALIRIHPINFGFLEEKEKDAVIYGFLTFLNNLNFPIQIVMRSVNLDMEEYLKHLKSRIEKRQDPLAMAYYEHFAEYLRNYLATNATKTKLFYLVIPVKSKGSEKATLIALSQRCERVMNSLAVVGVITQRLITQQLINFYSSYFTQSFNIHDSFISPAVMYKRMWKKVEKKNPK